MATCHHWLLTARLLNPVPRPNYPAASSSASTRSCSFRQTSTCAIRQPHIIPRTATTHIQMMPKLIQYLSLFIMRLRPRMDLVIFVKEIFRKPCHQSLQGQGDVTAKHVHHAQVGLIMTPISCWIPDYCVSRSLVDTCITRP